MRKMIFTISRLRKAIRQMDAANAKYCKEFEDYLIAKEPKVWVRVRLEKKKAKVKK